MSHGSFVERLQAMFKYVSDRSAMYYHPKYFLTVIRTTVGSKGQVVLEMSLDSSHSTLLIDLLPTPACPSLHRSPFNFIGQWGPRIKITLSKLPDLEDGAET